MTRERLREITNQLGWNLATLGAVLGRDGRLMRRWANGQNEIEEACAAWLEMVAANPPPPRPPRRTTPYTRPDRAAQ